MVKTLPVVGAARTRANYSCSAKKLHSSSPQVNISVLVLVGVGLFLSSWVPNGKSLGAFERLGTREISFGKTKLPRHTQKASAQACPRRAQTSQQQCLNALGKDGTWIQDWQFAASFGQHMKPNVVRQGPFKGMLLDRFRPSEEAPFRWETSWRWEDYNNNTIDDDKCQVDYTLDSTKFCQALLNLNISRILFYGDSLTHSHFMSLANKLGPSHVHLSMSDDRRLEASLVCQGNGDSQETTATIQLLSVKEGGGQDYPHNPRHPLFMSNHTKSFVTQARKGRLLGVLNIGAHYHNVTHYQEDLNELFEYFDHHAKTNDTTRGKNDLFYFRTTVPGHHNCEPRGRPRDFNWTAGSRLTPLKSKEDYVISSNHEWDLFEHYNAYTRRLLASRKVQETQLGRQAQADIRLLDVYGMTLLRSDGHTGGSDCLHYFEPGPVDWWNHLLYTHLVKEPEILASSCDDLSTNTSFKK